MHEEAKTNLICIYCSIGMDGLVTTSNGITTTDLQDLSAQSITSVGNSNDVLAVAAAAAASAEDAANAVSTLKSNLIQK